MEAFEAGQTDSWIMDELAQAPVLKAGFLQWAYNDLHMGRQTPMGLVPISFRDIQEYGEQLEMDPIDLECFEFNIRLVDVWHRSELAKSKSNGK